MRTTLDIDDDVLQAAKEIAAACGSTTGRVISDLVRKGMAPEETYDVFNGIRLMPRRPPGSKMPTMEMVNRLRDEELEESADE
jgi:hypothetical protein